MHTLLDRRHPPAEGFDVAAALERYLDSFPSREGQLELLRSWVAAAERGELSTPDHYARAIARAVDVMSSAPDVATAIGVLRRATPSAVL